MQTFTWEGEPDGVALETLTFEDLGDGRTRLHAQSLCDSFEVRDAWLRSGMEVGMNAGYANLDGLLAAGEVSGRGAGMSLPEDPAERHRAVSAGFTARVQGASDWDAPAPVDGWRARDVVAHLVEWFPEFLKTATGLELERGPSPEEDPVAAWQVHADAVQRLLDGPDAATPFKHPMVGEMPLPVAVDRFYTSDVFMHTWDLARATGQDERLDEQTCADMLAGMEPIEELLRTSGQYGPRVPVPGRRRRADAAARLHRPRPAALTPPRSTADRARGRMSCGGTSLTRCVRTSLTLSGVVGGGRCGSFRGVGRGAWGRW